MLSFGISNLNLGIFASSWGEAGSDIDKLLLRSLELKGSAFIILFQVPRLTSEIWKSSSERPIFFRVGIGKSCPFLDPRAGVSWRKPDQ